MIEPTIKSGRNSIAIQALIHQNQLRPPQAREKRLPGFLVPEDGDYRLGEGNPDDFFDTGRFGGRLLCALPGDGFAVCFTPAREFGRPKNKKDRIEDRGRIEKYSLAGGNEHILLVDDDEAMVNVFKDILEHIGYRVTWRTSPEKALELFESRPYYFDLVITDQRMPLMKGSELAGELLRIRPDMPIILCTGYSESISLEQAREIGFAAYILKPMGVETLAELIREVLESRRH